MFDRNKLGKNGFPKPVLSHLYMAKAFGGSTVGPIYTCHVIVVYRVSRRHKNIFNTKKLKGLN